MTNALALEGYWWRFATNFDLGAAFSLFGDHLAMPADAETNEKVAKFSRELGANLVSVRHLSISPCNPSNRYSPHLPLINTEIKTRIISLKKHQVETLNIVWSDHKDPSFIFRQDWPALRSLRIQATPANCSTFTTLIAENTGQLELLSVELRLTHATNFLDLISALATAKQATLKLLKFALLYSGDEYSKLLLPSKQDVAGLSTEAQKKLILERFQRYFKLPIKRVMHCHDGSLWKHLCSPSMYRPREWEHISVALYDLCHDDPLEFLKAYADAAFAVHYMTQSRRTLATSLLHYCDLDFDNFAVKHAGRIVSWIQMLVDSSIDDGVQLVALARRILRLRPMSLARIDHSTRFIRQLFSTTDWLDTTHPDFPTLVGVFSRSNFLPAVSIESMLPYVIEYSDFKLLLDGALLESLLSQLEALPNQYSTVVELLLNKYAQHPEYLSVLTSEHKIFRRKPIGRILRVPRVLQIFLKTLLPSPRDFAEACTSCTVPVWNSLLPILGSEPDNAVVDQILGAAWQGAMISCGADAEGLKTCLKHYMTLLPIVPRIVTDFVASGQVERFPKLLSDADLRAVLLEVLPPQSVSV
jgi:hypothetical protein